MSSLFSFLNSDTKAVATSDAAPAQKGGRQSRRQRQRQSRRQRQSQGRRQSRRQSRRYRGGRR